MNFARTLKTVTYLLVLTGILALTVADGTPLYIITALAAAPVSWLAVEVKGRGLGRASVHVLAGLLIFFAVVDSIFISGDMILGLAHLLVLVQVVKLFQLKHNRDYLQMYAISFVHVLVASVLTTDLIFSFFFAAYLVLGTWAMLLLHLKKASESHGQDPQGIISRRFFTSTLLVVVLAFVSTAVFFVLVPRVGMGLTIKSLKTRGLVSGFSEKVRLGEIGRIKKDSRVVMRVELLNAKPGQGFKPLWRGKAYDHYSNSQWKSRTSGSYKLLHRYGEKITLPLQVRAGGARVLKHRVQLEGTESRVIFLADSPAVVAGGMLYLWTGPSGTIYAPRPHLKGVKYTAYAVIANRQVAFSDDTDGVDQAYLQLPPLSPRVKELATKVAEDGRDNYSKARLIEAHLLRSYGYTLELNMRPGIKPVEYFLFEKKKGNCEYFASAMVLMLRSIGIPARLVGGFRGGEWNQFGRYYLVRQSNAHTWVEAYLPPAGWLSFDPTPVEEEPAFLLPAFLKIFPRMVDALRWRWQSHIIAFDIQDQRRMYLKVAHRAREVKLRGALLKEQVRQAVVAAFSTKGHRLLALAIMAGIAGVVIALVKRGHRFRAEGGGNGDTPVRFYRHYLRIMAGKGFRKLPSMTPLEFAHRAVMEGGERFKPAERITETYYRTRYGGEDAEEDELTEIYRQLNMLKKASIG